MYADLDIPLIDLQQMPTRRGQRFAQACKPPISMTPRSREATSAGPQPIISDIKGLLLGRGCDVATNSGNTNKMNIEYEAWQFSNGRNDQRANGGCVGGLGVGHEAINTAKYPAPCIPFHSSNLTIDRLCLKLKSLRITHPQQ